MLLGGAKIHDRRFARVKRRPPRPDHPALEVLKEQPLAPGGRSAIRYAVEDPAGSDLPSVNDSICGLGVALQGLNLAGDKYDIVETFNKIETVPVKVYTTDQFIDIGVCMKEAGSLTIMELQGRPAMVYDVFEIPIAFFPETPGPVVTFFSLAVD